MFSQIDDPGCRLPVEHRRDRRFERQSAAGAQEPVDDGLQAAIFGAPSASAESVLVLAGISPLPHPPGTDPQPPQ
jgi:hypothetical protein